MQRLSCSGGNGMIETFYSSDTLHTGGAATAALMIGIAFGFILQRAGFSSSRRLAAVFYFKDMTVIKVMLTAVITAMLGLVLVEKVGWLSLESLYLLPTIYGAQVIGGLLFGVGFVMGGWCPGTAAVGLGQGKIDALLFLVGVLVGGIVFNEVFALVKPLYTAGSVGVVFVYDSLDVSPATFIVGFTLAGIICFGLCEYVQQLHSTALWQGPGRIFTTVSLSLVTLALCLAWIPAQDSRPAMGLAPDQESKLLQQVDMGADHMEPEALADRLMAHEADLLLVDIRPEEEYLADGIPSAVNIVLGELHTQLLPYKNTGTIVLYSNGMTHPVQARDSLSRAGFHNVFILTDGLTGFKQRCLKPVSLRSEPLSPEQVAAINQWRAFFSRQPTATERDVPDSGALPLLGATVKTEWLHKNLGNPSVVVIDVRNQAQYNTSHIPGSLALGAENIRTHVKGLGSMLSPVEILAQQVSLMGIMPSDTIVLVPSEAIRDATLVGLALERVGHSVYALLEGGFEQWVEDGLPLSTNLPDVVVSNYPTRLDADIFTVAATDVLAALRKHNAVIIDVRPAEYFQGKKSDEPRSGHIKGAINRPYTDDLHKSESVTTFKSLSELGAVYARLIPSKKSRVIVHCRTGHQASQTVFVLKHLLGYENVLWYDGGWSEWAARSTLPI